MIGEQEKMKATKRTEVNNPITVDITSLQAMLGVGKTTADRIGREANAVIKVGKRKLFSVDKIRAYMESHTENGGSDHE